VKKYFWLFLCASALTLQLSGSASAQPDKKDPVEPPKLKQVEPPKKEDVKAPEVKAPEKAVEKAVEKAPEKAPVPEAKAAVEEKKAEEKKDEPKFAVASDFDAAKSLLDGLKIGGDTVWVMITGMLVFFMNLGFATVESGMCRAKNCVNILSKNFIVFAVTTIGFWAIGWGIMFGNGDDWVGKSGLYAVNAGVDNSPVSTLFDGKLIADVKEATGVDLSDKEVAAKFPKLKGAVDKYAEEFLAIKSNTIDKVVDKKVVINPDTKKPEQVDVEFPVKISEEGKTFEKTYLAKEYYWGPYKGIAWPTVPLWAKFFFQLVFAGTAATIVSGAVAERIKYHAFIIFSLAMAIVIYPVVGHWVWGGGKLQSMGFLDFAGSTQVHSIGGWAALVAVIILGPRIGKYGPNGKVNAIPGHNMTAATIGCLILWFGWFGFNPGSTMSIADPGAIAEVAVTTNLAAAMATLTATITAWLLMGKPDIGMTLNGCLAGLVAVTAGCAFFTAEVSLIIGAIAGVVVVVAVISFDKCGIDDPVGATSVHLVNGVFGTLAIGIFAHPDKIYRAANPEAKAGLFYGAGTAQLMTQLTGVLYTAGYVIIVSAIVWIIIKAIFGMRVSAAEELEGLDIGEHGNEAYHGFQMISPEIMSGGVEPKSAALPKDGKKRFSVVVEGLPADKLASIWGDLCQPNKKPSPDFLAVYPKMTLLTGNKFRFIDGNPEQVSAHLAKVLQAGAGGGAVKTVVEK
jgi:Amt family ammonium transporter